jgi:dethiobiotin synthetase
MEGFVITGTDTGVGKTVFAAALTSALNGVYWKPIQSGAEEQVDSDLVIRLADIPPSRALPEAYRFKAPLSPHRAAELEKIKIDPGKLVLPETTRPLIIEGAGGVLVPITRKMVYADVFARWKLPVILVCRTTLGTINHTLLSLEALRRRRINVTGVVFVGDETDDVERTICEMGQTFRLGRLPYLDPLTHETLQSAFAARFSLGTFTSKKAA